MKILLIGGTGVISTAISEKLLQDGHELYLLNRRGGKNLPHGAHELRGDINDEAAVAALLDGLSFDAVADFICFTPEQAERDFKLFAGKTKQYVLISTASAYQKPLTALPITESTPLVNPYWDYSRSKAAAEELLLRHLRHDGFPVTIVRPSHTYCERKVPVAVHGAAGSWQVLARMLAGKPVVVHGDGSSLWTLTHSRDFAKGFCGLLGNPHAIGQAVHITSDESLSWNQIYAILADALGVPLRAVYVPSTVLAEAGTAWGYDFEGNLLGDKAVSVVFDNTKLKRLVPGFTATTRFDEGAREAVAYLLAHPELQIDDPTFDRFCDAVCDTMSTVARQIAGRANEASEN